MKKFIFAAVFFSLTTTQVAFAIANKPADVSQGCYDNYRTGTVDGCTSAELNSLDAANGVAAQNSGIDNQGQAAQLNNQGRNATANPATQIQTTNTTQTQAAQPSTVNTQGSNLGYTPLEPIPGINTNSSGQAITFSTLLGNIYRIAIIIGALFSVLMLTVSGIRYMVSDVVTDKQRAKKRIWACIYGLVLIAASWLILNTINPRLVTFTLAPPQVSINSAQTGGIGNPGTLTGGGTSATPPQVTVNQFSSGFSIPSYAGDPNASAAQQSQFDSYTMWCSSKGGRVSPSFSGSGNYVCSN